MNDMSSPVNQLAMTTNAAMMLKLAEELISRPLHLPGIGVFSGPAGFGKSFAAILTANQHQSICLKVETTMTPKAFLEDLADEMGVSPKGTTHQIAKRVSAFMLDQGNLLIIDEVDHLVKRDGVEVIRSIFDKSQCPIILIGEELLPQNLQSSERMWSRVYRSYQAAPAGVEDVRLMAELYCPNVTLDDDLFDALMKASGASLRRAALNLDEINRSGVRQGKDVMSLADFDQRGFKDGTPPSARRSF